MFRNSVVAVLAFGLFMSGAATRAAMAEEPLAPMDRYVLTGVYNEMVTCFAFVTIVSTVAKTEGDTETQQHYQDQGFTFMQGYEFFGGKIGKTSTELSSEVAAAIMSMHEKSGKLTNTLPMKVVYNERCTNLKTDPKPTMMEYITKYQNGAR